MLPPSICCCSKSGSTIGRKFAPNISHSRVRYHCALKFRFKDLSLFSPAISTCTFPKPFYPVHYKLYQNFQLIIIAFTIFTPL